MKVNSKTLLGGIIFMLVLFVLCAWYYYSNEGLFSQVTIDHGAGTVLKSTLIRDNINGDSRFLIKNDNAGNLANSQVTLENDIGKSLSLRMGSSALNASGTEGANSGSLVLSGDAPMMFGLLYNQPYRWKVNFTDDGTLDNTTEIMSLDSSGLYIENGLYVDSIQTLSDTISFADQNGDVHQLTFKYGTLLSYEINP